MAWATQLLIRTRSIASSVTIQVTAAMDAAHSIQDKQQRKDNRQMTVEVELNMFKFGTIRIVTVPREVVRKVKRLPNPDKLILEEIWKYGQNDFQPQELPSVSMGDVIRYKGERYMVMSLGFKKLKPGQYIDRPPTITETL